MTAPGATTAVRGAARGRRRAIALVAVFAAVPAASVGLSSALGIIASPAPNSIDPGMTVDPYFGVEALASLFGLVALVTGAILQSTLGLGVKRRDRVVVSVIAALVGACVGSGVGLGLAYLISNGRIPSYVGVPIAWIPLTIAVVACVLIAFIAATVPRPRASTGRLPFPARILSVAIVTLSISTLALTTLAIVDSRDHANYTYLTPTDEVDVSLYEISDSTGHETFSNAGRQVLADVNASVRGGARLISTSSEIGEVQKSAFPVVVPRLLISPQCRANPSCDSPWLHDFGHTDFEKIVIGTPADFPALIGAKASAQSRATLRAGGVVSFFTSYVANGSVVLDWKNDSDSKKVSKTETVAATTQIPAHPYYVGMIMSPATATRLGIVAMPSRVVAAFNSTDHRLQTNSLDKRLGNIGKDGLYAHVERGPQPEFVAQYWIIAGLTVLILAPCAATALLTRRRVTRHTAPA